MSKHSQEFIIFFNLCFSKNGLSKIFYYKMSNDKIIQQLNSFPFRFPCFLHIIINEGIFVQK